MKSMRSDLISIFKMFFEIIKFNKIAIYVIRPRFGQAASGIPLFMTEINNLYPKAKIFITNYNSNLFFKEYLKKSNCNFIENKKLAWLVNFIFNNLGFNLIRPYTKNYFKNEVNTFDKIIINNLIIDNILTANKLVVLNKFDFNQKFICISIKEREFYASSDVYKNYINPDLEFDSIERFQKIINYYINSGYNVVRMGRNLKKASFEINGFFDYASSDLSSDINDVIFSQKCEFVLSNQTGFDFLPAYWFSKPIYIYQIRYYRFIMENFPFRLFNPVKATQNGIILNYEQTMEIESSLWKTYNQNDLHVVLNKNNIKYILYSDNEILISSKLFLKDFEENLKFNNNLNALHNEVLTFWNTFNYYLEPHYKKLGRPLNNQINYTYPNLDILKYNANE